MTTSPAVLQLRTELQEAYRKLQPQIEGLQLLLGAVGGGAAKQAVEMALRAHVKRADAIAAALDTLDTLESIGYPATVISTLPKDVFQEIKAAVEAITIALGEFEEAHPMAVLAEIIPGTPVQKEPSIL